MALKKKITKDEHAKLSAEFQAEYKASGDDFVLDVSGDEDTGALKRAKDREKQRADDAEKAKQELEDQLAALQGDDARKTGDIKTLEKAWQKKLDDKQKESDLRIGKLTAHTTKSLVDSVATAIASKISNSPALLLPHIRARLVADLDADEPVTKILDKDGKPSAMTIEQLSAEFVANKDFASIMIASKSSGGAKGQENKGGGATKFSDQNEKPADLSKMNPRQLAERIREQKATQQEA